MILRTELREEADRYLERTNGAHTAATCNDGLWAFSREELIDLLEEFGVYAITLHKGYPLTPKEAKP